MVIGGVNTGCPLQELIYKQAWIIMVIGGVNTGCPLQEWIFKQPRIIMVSILSLYLFPSTLGVFLHLTAWVFRWWFPALRGMKPVRISDSLNLWLFLTQAKAVVKSACPIGGWGLSTLMLFIKGLNTPLYLSLTLYYPQKNPKGCLHSGKNIGSSIHTSWKQSIGKEQCQQHGWSWRPTNIKGPLWWWLIPPLNIT